MGALSPRWDNSSGELYGHCRTIHEADGLSPIYFSGGREFERRKGTADKTRASGNQRNAAFFATCMAAAPSSD
jgi:hypothetical protein